MVHEACESVQKTGNMNCKTQSCYLQSDNHLKRYIGKVSDEEDCTQHTLPLVLRPDFAITAVSDRTPAVAPPDMEVDNGTDWPTRWSHLQKVLERKSPLHNPDYEPVPEILQFLRNGCRILLIGAGGLGCELIKNLALMGFGHIDIIDMDTIDLSNLNRQFLFRQKDIGRPKAEVAAEFINKRIKGVTVTPHYKQIQDMDRSFYSSFHLIVCGLDSVVARRWISGMLVQLLEYDNEGNLQQETVVPLVDGGTEGLKGNVRVIMSGMTACIDCTLDLFPPAVNFPLCTIAHMPRLPEHCVEYAKILLWPKEQPFGDKVAVDGDDPAHVSWIYEKALSRAQEHNIPGVTYRLTQGVIKRIIPAVASTNAVIAAVCATEAFKLATTCFSSLNNYMLFTDADGVYTYCYEAEKKTDCLNCSRVPKTLTCKPSDKLQDIMDRLVNDHQLREPGITTMYANGRNKTLYMPKPEVMHQKTKDQLKQSLQELGLTNGQQVFVSDVTSPVSLTFTLSYQ